MKQGEAEVNGEKCGTLIEQKSSRGKLWAAFGVEQLPRKMCEQFTIKKVWARTVLEGAESDGIGNRPTPVQTCARHLYCFPDSQLMRQLKSQRRGTTKANRYLGCAAPRTASAVGDKSLMWVCHITGTPGCSTANVHNQHSLG